MAALTALCVFSYNWNSPSDANDRESFNLIGSAGRFVAKHLFRSFGSAAFALPFCLLIIGWKLFRSKTRQSMFAAILGVSTFILSASALASLFSDSFGIGHWGGGLAGSNIAKILGSALNRVGAAIALCALTLIGLLLMSRFSFSRLFDRSARVLKKLAIAARRRLAQNQKDESSVKVTSDESAQDEGRES